MTSQRLQLFKQKGCSCVVCGLEGSFFAVEIACGHENPHINLYAINSKGEEVLMTKDHILPRSRGGENTQENYQTMCIDCNMDKGNSLEHIGPNLNIFGDPIQKIGGDIIVKFYDEGNTELSAKTAYYTNTQNLSMLKQPRFLEILCTGGFKCFTVSQKKTAFLYVIGKGKVFKLKSSLIPINTVFIKVED